MVVENFDLAQPKTKAVQSALSSLGAESSVLLIADGAEPQVLRATGNIPRVKMMPSHTLNTIDLLNHRTVVMTEQAVRNVESIWGGRFERRPSRSAEPVAVGE